MKTFPIVKLLAVAALSLVTSLASAAWPERPITMVVPWNPGGSTDASARIIAKMLEADLGVPVNVVNRTGGNGVVGHKATASAKPDGYTLGMVTVEIGMMRHIGLTDLGPADYTPLAMMSSQQAAITVKADSPYETLPALLDAAKTDPGKLKASGTGEGGIWQIALAGMLDSLDLAPDLFRWVPSDGAAPAMLELAAGGVDVVSVSLGEARSLIDAGKARPLAVMAPEPVALYPDVPTLASLTGSDWTVGAWASVCAPKGLPDDIRDQLVQALDKAYHSDEYKAFMTSRGLGMAFVSGDDFAEFMATDDANMGRVFKKIGLAKD